MDLFAFFKFYFYTITRNNNKRLKLVNSMDMFPVLVTPVVLFIIHMITSFVVLYSYPSNMVLTYTMPIWIFIIIFNLAYANIVRDRIWKAEREKRYEREREDKERRKQAEIDRQYRMYRERIKQRLEQERQSKERRERMHSNSSKINQNNNTNYRNSLTLMGLNDGASEKEIKSAYKRLAKVHHPDLGGTEKNFIKLKKAYDYLMNK